MSNYTKTTNFATKDALASGNPAKIVKGTEIDTEFNNIAVASGTKADKASPTFTGTVTLPVTNADSLSIGGDGVTVTGIKDEDDMASNSATKLASQQSIKAYVDSQVTAQDLDVTDGTTSISIDLDSEALSLLGGTGVTSTAAGNGVTLAIDGTVATLSGTQTLTNKTLTSPDVNTPDIDGGTIDGTVIGGTTAAAGSFTTVDATGNIIVGGTIDGRDVAVDGTKLDGIESGATADQTAAEIKTAYESNADTNAFTDADESKLDGIEALADVTDTVNVTAAGALMDSELTSIASVKALDQGVATTDSPTFAAATVTGEITANGGIALGDNDKATFGASDDLQIYHDGANSYIQNATNSLIIQNDSDDKQVVIKSDNGSGGVADYFRANGTTGEALLYHYGSAKLATTSTGIDVTGDVSIGDGSASATRLLMGSGDDSKMFHNGTDTYWINDTGNIIIRNQSDDKDILIQTDDGSGGTTTYITVDGSETDVSLHYGGAEKLATTSTGIDVTGNMESDSVTIGVGAVAGTEKLRVNGTVLTLGGTNSVPAIGIGDVNTGIYAPTVGTLGWAVNGTQKLLLDSTGIDVTGEITADALTINSSGVQIGTVLQSTSTTSARLALMDANTTAASQVGIGATGNTLGLYAAGGLPKVVVSATGIDVTGTATMDGLTVANTAVIAGDFDGGTAATYIRLQDDTDNFLFGSNNSLGNFLIKNETADAFRLSVANTGDISFYEDTGTTPKFFWDASAESLGIGTSSPATALSVVGDITTTGGVYLGGTGAANKLDDYEEGTFTPVIADAVTGGNEATSTTAIGKYTKVGNLVTIVVDMLNIDTTGLTTGVAIILRDVPFSAESAVGGVNYTGSVLGGGTLTTPRIIFAAIQDNQQYLRFQEADASGVSNFLNIGSINSGVTDIRFSLTYQAA